MYIASHASSNFTSVTLLLFSLIALHQRGRASVVPYEWRTYVNLAVLPDCADVYSPLPRPIVFSFPLFPAKISGGFGAAFVRTCLLPFIP